MNIKTIHQLNHINQTFYETVSKEFNETRQQPWDGWKKSLLYFPMDKHLKVLDIGCGNGRFAGFLVENFPKTAFKYTGIDNNQFLIQQAQERLQAFRNIEPTFIADDIIQNLDTISSLGKFDVIVLFGVMHHIPSFNHRQKLLQNLNKLMNENGVVIFSAWQFLSIPALKKRIVNWNEVPEIDNNELEENDFLLDWQRGSRAYRYCHWINEEELGQLLKSLQYTKVKQYYADGKNGKSNLYVVLNKQLSIHE